MSIIFLYISQTWEVPTVHPQEARPPPAAAAQPGYEGLGESTAWGPSGVAGLRSQTSRAEWGKKSTKNNKEWRISPAKLKLRFQTNIRILSELLFNLRHIDTSKKMGLAKQTLWHGMCFVVFSILGGVNCLVICIANLKLFFFDFSIQKIGLCWVMLVIQTFRCNLEPGIEPIETVPGCESCGPWRHDWYSCPHIPRIPHWHVPWPNSGTSWCVFIRSY
jgi:hypothetical protein